MARDTYDLIVVGAGIVGLGHAAAAVERGLKVAIVERADAIAGASIRNFGHIGVGAHAGQAGEYARRSRELWLRLAERAGLWIRQDGAIAVARHEDELAVLRESNAGPLLSADEVSELVPVRGAVGGIRFADDLQVDPRAAGRRSRHTSARAASTSTGARRPSGPRPARCTRRADRCTLRRSSSP